MATSSSTARILAVIAWCSVCLLHATPAPAPPTCLAPLPLPSPASTSELYSLSEWKLKGVPDVCNGPGRWISGDVFDGDKLVVGQKQAGPPPSRQLAGWPEPFLVFNKTTGEYLNKRFGNKAVLKTKDVDREFGGGSPYGSAWSLEKMSVLRKDPSKKRMQDLLWFADYQMFTVTVMNFDGEIVQIIGRDGDPAGWHSRIAEGSRLEPAIPASQTAVDKTKFGNPAGLAFFEDTVFVSDGEDFSEQINRVAAWKLNTTSGTALTTTADSVKWVYPVEPPSTRTEQVFRTPHSIVYHQPSGKLFVGDRGKPANYYTPTGKPGDGNINQPTWNKTDGHARILILDPQKGTNEGEFDCSPLGLSIHKVPVSIATFKHPDMDLLFVSTGGYNRSAGGWSDNAGIYIVDIVTKSTKSKLGCSKVVQHLPISIEECDVLHDIKVDPDTGDVYVFCPGIAGDRVRKLILNEAYNNLASTLSI